MTEANDTIRFGRGTSSYEDVDQLLHPARFYARPDDVVADELLTIDERRAILSSWASDACAVESNPQLRHPPFASAPVTFDDIMDALVRLDRMRERAATPTVARWPQRDVRFARSATASQKYAIGAAN